MSSHDYDSIVSVDDAQHRVATENPKKTDKDKQKPSSSRTAKGNIKSRPKQSVPANQMTREETASVDANTASKKGQCHHCENPDDEEMVACDLCHKWFHFKCVGVDEGVSERDWQCGLCTASKNLVPSKPPSSANNNLALEKIKSQRKLDEKIARERRKLQEKRDNEYLEELRKSEEKFISSRFEVLSEISESDSMSEASANRAKDWVNKHSNSGQNNVVASENEKAPNLSENHKTGAAFYDGKVTFCEPCAEDGRTNNHAVNSMGIFRSHPQSSTPSRLNQRQSIGTLSQMLNSYSGRSTNQLNESQIAARLERTPLPTFSGSPADWPVFISTYLRTTERCGYTDDDNLGRLIKALTGEAKSLVKARLVSPKAVTSVIETLYRNYGRPDIILEELTENIQKLPNVTTERMDILMKLSANVEDLCATLENTMMVGHLTNPILLNQLVRKLPTQLQLGWSLHTEGMELADLATFNKWLISMANAVSRLPKSKTRPSSSENKSGKRFNKSPYTLAAHEAVAKKGTTNQNASKSDASKCEVCNVGTHSLDLCPRFLEMSKRERWDVIKTGWFCRTCLKKHQRICPVGKRCGVDGCARFHHALLHNSNEILRDESDGTDVTKMGCTSAEVHYHHSVQSVIYRIIPVYLYGPKKRVKTFAFLDEGSSVTLLEESIAEEIGVDGPKSDLCLKWTGDVVRTEDHSKLVSFEMSGVMQSSKRFSLSGVNTVKCLGLPCQTVSSTMMNSFRHLRRLPVSPYEGGQPSIIIGLDNYYMATPLRTKIGTESEPIAVKTPLGWTIYGTNSQVPNDKRICFHRCDCNVKMDDQLHAMVNDFFSLESFGVVPANPLESKEVHRAKDIMDKTTRYVGGRYQTGLLWKFDKISMPNSKEMALRRLSCFENKLLKNPSLLQIVNEKIQDYLSKGYAMKIDNEMLLRGPRTWYLPIFSVQNPNKPSKVRLVWDAAAKSHGVSLNDFLLKGPDQMASLMDILFRFRENRVAITGDIREMFHQVEISEPDRDSQRFLWRNCDRSKEPDEYLMRVMTFGATCSPSSAQYIKNINAQKFVESHPRAVKAIQANHYVDDWLDSFDSTEKAIEVARRVKEIHAVAGFEMRNWRSNDRSVLRALGESSGEEKSLCGSENPMDKILGLWWRTDDDTLVYRVNIARGSFGLLDDSKVPTKRQVLSAVMSIFDPLGLISPMLVHGKVILQEIWRAGLSWDQEISGDILTKWHKWVNKLVSIEQLEIPRSYMVDVRVGLECVYDLHVFCDAGGDAHAACAYMRISSPEGVHVTLVAAKTRVNPSNVVSIPRLELLAAVLAVRLLKMVREAHTFQLNSCTIWTDSTTVLGWLGSDARQYKQFVAFRICECLESTEFKQWRYIPSKMNASDEATKWFSHSIQSTGQWFRGPEFLRLSPSDWPTNPHCVKKDANEELRPYVMYASSKKMIILNVNPENFSKWTNLVRSQAYFERALENFWRRKRVLYNRSPFDLFDFENAKMTLIKRAQWDVYKNEISSLMMDPNNYVEKSSPLYSYSPYLDENGILRVMGRIDNARHVPVETKRPIILPPKHIISYRLVHHFHCLFLHQNNETIINEVRQIYMIINLRVLYRRVVKDCMVCKIRSAKPHPPVMGLLPEDRLQAFIRPFTCVGVDLFGPMNVAVGRRNEKRWGVLYTCLSVRAIHLEPITSLSTDSFIRNLVMFIARRGIPRRIYSDNATNFHGAHNALSEEESAVDMLEVADRFAHIEWRFIPPGAPHFGGAWERLVKTVKNNLNMVLKEAKPSDEVLRACLCEVEVIVNTRPLTHIPIDNEEAEALTPNHFIHGTSDGHKPLCNVDDDYTPTYQNWRYVQWVGNQFWKRFLREYLPNLTRRGKWFEPVKPIEIGDVVLIVDDHNVRGSWPRGRIVDVTKGADGCVRSAIVKTAHGIYTRPVSRLAKLDILREGQKLPATIDRGGEC